MAGEHAAIPYTLTMPTHGAYLLACIDQLTSTDIYCICQARATCIHHMECWRLIY